ncbi:MAG: bacillolysin, partial [Saprospiraceae bacterium]|nr:bacillolysin [Saprospiraceae bacterium]
MMNITGRSSSKYVGKEAQSLGSFDGKIKWFMHRNKLLTVFILISAVYHLQSQTKSDRIRDFVQQTGARITVNKALGNPEFIRFPTNTSVFSPGTPEQMTQAFLSSYSDLMGIEYQAGQLTLQEQRTDHIGHQQLIYKQVYQGIPVFAAEMRFHYDQQGLLAAINGVFVPDIKISPEPAVSIAQAQNVAISHIEKQFPTLAQTLEANAGGLYIFRKGLIQNVPGSNHLVYEIVVENHVDVREFVYVDAHTLDIIEQFTGTHGILSRKLYEETLSNNIWSEGDALPGSLDIWQQNEVEAAGHTYYFFKHAFGFDSYNGSGATMKTINNNPGINCPNANWNGSTTNYCDGTASDDVVAHEWAHAYTDYTSDLIYAWQSGALNESYSDIWGETVDLLNNYEDVGEDLSLRSGCASSQRWRLGEDASAFGSALRDMWDPTCKGDPGKVSDPQYYCSSGDNGGVHTNSGVPNHAYSLLVDGGSYNGQTINGIGFTKAAHIFWRAQSTYLTSTSDFSVMADALEMACNSLIGVNLEGLSTTSVAAGPSGEIINSNDLLELQKVLLAVEMRMDPDCPFSPILGAAPALCLAAIPDSTIFYEDFESGFGAWTVVQIPENPLSWEDRDWELTTDLPDLRAGTAAFGPDPINGDCGQDLENGIISLVSPSILIPLEVPDEVELAFEHYISTEYRWDGAHVMYKINEAAWLQVPASSFTVNGYNTTLNTAAQGNDNP